MREKSRFPNNFAQKLRKHIRNRRIEAIRQIGFDRIIDLVFGNGENTFHVIVECYSGGNIILTDCHFEIMALLRTYTLPDGTAVDVKQTYTVRARQHDPFGSIQAMDVSALDEMCALFLPRWSELKAREKQIKSLLLTNGLFSLLGSAFVTNALHRLGVSPLSVAENEGCLRDEEHRVTLLQALKEEAARVEAALEKPQGFILRSEDLLTAEDKAANAEPYTDFSPFAIAAGERESTVAFASFNECLDAYFVNEENLKVAERVQKSREAIDKKVLTISQKQEERIRSLERELHEVTRRVSALFANASIVNTAIVVINQYLSQGVQWDVLQEQVRVFKQKPYNVFHHIKSLDLEHNRMKMVFEVVDDEDESDVSDMSAGEDDVSEDGKSDGKSDAKDAEKSRQINVDVELSLNCNNNIALLYKQKKELEEKLEKTIAAARQAVAEASKQQQKEIVRVERTQQTEIARRRQKRWFEKFDWFVTSEDYLVLGGKSGDQNELLVKKYLRRGDVFMHADVYGAATVVIRNYMSVPAGSDTIPARCRISEVSLQQAAVFALCHSVSWDNNLISKVYWVFDHQVSKTAPDGELLPPGSFMIRGKKNYLAPYRLELGLGLLFEVESAHRCERKRKDLTEEEWERVIASGRPSEEPDSEGEEVAEEEDEEYTVEVMNEVTNVSKPKPVVKVQSAPKAPKGKKAQQAKHAQHAQQAKENKKAQKGTTKKSRAQAEEEALLNDGIEEAKPKGKELSRGERRKLKKAKKYAECDDEEMRLRNVLYGRASLESVLKGDEKASNSEKMSVKGEEKASVKGEEKASVKGEAKGSGLETASATETAPVTGEETAPLPTTVDGMPDVNEASTLEEIDAYLEQLVSMEPAKPTQLCYTCGSSEHDQAHCPESWRVIEHVDEKEAEKEEKEAEKEEKEAEKEEKEMEEKEAEAVTQTEKEAEAETEKTETKTQTESDLLLNWTANPTETDRILHAIPVCAPYAALNEYAFHVKMTVGKMKKGAMAKSVVDYWLKSKIPEEQKKSILQIPVEDISAIIMNNAKVVLPGGRK
ncbi:hypothetical protein BLSTO_00224 [Blastocystis sp. subtype 1]